MIHYGNCSNHWYDYISSTLDSHILTSWDDTNRYKNLNWSWDLYTYVHSDWLRWQVHYIWIWFDQQLIYVTCILQSMNFSQITTQQPKLKYALLPINNIQWSIPSSPILIRYILLFKQSLTFLSLLSASNPLVSFCLSIANQSYL